VSTPTTTHPSAIDAAASAGAAATHDKPAFDAASRIGANNGGSPSATTITFIDLTSPIRILFSP
jgi:hypothetical protein